VARIPLLAGSRIAIVNTGDDSVLLTPPPPREPVGDVASAVRDALRFPLAGEPLEALVPRGGRATVVIEPPAMPVPFAPVDPRMAAIAAAVDELQRAGIATGRRSSSPEGSLGERRGATSKRSSRRSSRAASAASSRCTTRKRRTSRRWTRRCDNRCASTAP
jgi:hypothetical protein